jgi:hypothetical protein
MTKVPQHRATAGAACVVCKLSDVRALTTTTLATGANVSVCGTHALIHERAPMRAESVVGLKDIAGNRRERRERRDGTADELGAQLIAAFSGERRRKNERRAI